MALLFARSEKDFHYGGESGDRLSTLSSVTMECAVNFRTELDVHIPCVTFLVFLLCVCVVVCFVFFNVFFFYFYFNFLKYLCFSLSTCWHSFLTGAQTSAVLLYVGYHS